MTHRSQILLVLMAFCFAACGEREESETPVVVTDGQTELDEQENETPAEENTGEVIEPAVPKKLTGIDAKLEESAVYFQSLSNLMASYQPELPDVVDNTDLLRCVTEESRSLDKDYGKLEKALKKERKTSLKERKKIQNDFYERIYPLNFRLDFDWRTRPGFSRKPVYGCWYYGRWEADYYCPSGFGGTRKPKSSKLVEDPSVNLYSGNQNPAMPELMIRAQDKGMLSPARHYCNVGGVKVVERSPRKVRVRCLNMKETPFVIDLLGEEASGLQLGDVISVPHGEQRGFATGLIYADFNHGRSGAPELDMWVLNGNLSAIKVENSSPSCPSDDAISKELCRFATKTSDPSKVLDNCQVSRNVMPVKNLVKQWGNRKFENKAAVMVRAYDMILPTAERELKGLYQLGKGKYLLQAGDLIAAKSAFNAALEEPLEVKDLLAIGKLASSSGLEKVEERAYRIGCEAESKKACKKLARYEKAKLDSDQ